MQTPKKLQNKKGGKYMEREIVLEIYNEVIEKVRKDPTLNELKTRHIELVLETYEKVKSEPTE